MSRLNCRTALSGGVRAFVLVLLASVAQLMAVQVVDARDDNAAVHVVRISGAIGTGTSVMIDEALEDAKSENAVAVVLEIDTPGGLVAATREIIKSMLSSSVPVVVFVSPSGARAASAGTYIAYAAHVVAMAPGTHLGAATPIQMSLPGMPQRQPTTPGSPSKDEQGAKEKSAAENKMLNDAIAYLRTLAQLRGRSEAWADKFVRDAATLTAREAHKEGVIDLIASDVPALLRALDGREVKMPDGSRTLRLGDLKVKTVEPSWKVKFLTSISDPNIAFILLLIGVYGILFEFWSPGLTGPGVVGGISLIVALFALSALPVSYAGLALLLLGLVLMAGEAVSPGIGILGIGGVIAFILGAIFLFDPEGSDIEVVIYTPLIVAAAATSALLLVGLLGYLLRSRQREVVTGSEELIGLEGDVVSWEDGGGRVRVHGEVWSARASKNIAVGARVKVVERDGLTLLVQEQ